MVEQVLNVILAINIVCGPKHMMLGMYDDIIVVKHKNTLCKFPTFCARKCILLKWLMDKAPSQALRLIKLLQCFSNLS